MQREIDCTVYSKSKNFARVFTFFRETDLFVAMLYNTLLFCFFHAVGIKSIKVVLLFEIPLVIYVFFSSIKSKSKQDTYYFDLIYYLMNKKIIIPDHLEYPSATSTIPFTKREAIKILESKIDIVVFGRGYLKELNKENSINSIYEI